MERYGASVALHPPPTPPPPPPPPPANVMTDAARCGPATPSSLLSSLISVFSPRFLASTRWWSFQPHFLLPLPPLPPPLPLPLQRIPPSTWMRWSEDLISGALRYSHTVNKTACIPSDNATRFSSLLPPPSSLLHLPLSPATEEGSTLNSAPLPQLLPHGR